METQLGKNTVRKEAKDKVTGAARYTNDITDSPMLYARLLTSVYAHAQIISIDTMEASAMPGVKAVITANDHQVICGSMLQDRPPLARDKVRYYGEPVAIVVADDEMQAKAAVRKILVEYKPLPVVNSIKEAFKRNPVIIHEPLMLYTKATEEVYPVKGTNICHHQKIRKGDMQKGWLDSEIVVEGSFSLPQSDHAAMETRAVHCMFMPDGSVKIKTSSQAPYEVKESICKYLNIPEGKIVVQVPFVGGAFGGKTCIQQEVLAVIAAMNVKGKWINLANTREEDMVTSPCHLGLEGTIRIGAKKSGQIMAAEMTFQIDTGAYSDISPKITKAIAAECAGPYRIPNIQCDCYSVYTNHPYITSFRGFGHEAHTFCLERMMDKLAFETGLDPFQLRLINLVQAGDLTPTQVKVTASNTGNAAECLERLKKVINWEEGARIAEENGLVRAKGISCLIKTSDTPTDAGASAVLTFNSDGSINLDCGAAEIGPGMKTTAAQILAEKMRISVNDVYVKLDVNTQSTPYLWKTVASMTTFLVGRAVLNAADDVISQLMSLASIALRCPAEDLDFENKMIYVKHDPERYVMFEDLVKGYKFSNGNSLKGPVIGRGSYVMNHLTPLNEASGRGTPGRSWTVGAQAVEIEYDTRLHTYRLLKAVTVIDAGKVINPKTARGVVMGGMCMGLGLGTSEDFVYDEDGIVEDTSFRTYKMIRYGENPEYVVDFVETPQIDAPFGARGIAEHGIIGIPAALANAISLAAHIDVNRLPITPEFIWRERMKQ
ncbi:xanthine dehydrogenase family protein molybdopterin-binding subunit [Lacrimispora sp.]|uniref:xanthine dehydrogenase family protein molybdopterin-binding subunit n=1 Tax=Lacrimispora sp. TaxID=2719234 RepID=UPI0028A68705|nr:xanthine dehydrogenase family protein molybdopterin-binding subunit [Lacrimispora sp.]